MDSAKEIVSSNLDLYEKSNYRKAAYTLASIARSSGTEVSTQTVSNWETFMFAMRQVDSYIDDSPNLSTSKERMDEVLEFITGDKEQIGENGSNLDIFTNKLRNMIGPFPEMDRQLIFKETKNIFDLEMKIRFTQDPNEFATARRLIGQKTGRLLLAFVDDPDQRKAISHMFKLIGRFGTDVDTLADWKRDYQRSEHQLPLNMKNLIPTVTSSVVDLVAVLKGYGPIIVKNLSHLGASTLVTLTGETRKEF